MRLYITAPFEGYPDNGVLLQLLWGQLVKDLKLENILFCYDIYTFM